MKRIVLAACLTGLAFGANAESYTVDPQHTYPNFTISHLGFSTMHGMFTSTKGSLEMDRKAGTGKVEVTIDAASVFTGFKKRDDHLRSPDFFNAVEFPEIKFKSTAVEFNGDTAKVTGDLTILNTTKSVVLDVSSINCGKHPFNPKINEVCGFDAITAFKRSEFGMQFGLPAVGDDVKLNLQLEANR